jgi:hypothetical protein
MDRHPENLLHRLDIAPNLGAEGLSIALRTIKALESIEGAHGVQIMAVN